MRIVCTAILLLAVVFIVRQLQLSSAAPQRPIEEISTTYLDIAYCGTDNKAQTLDLLIPNEQLLEKNPLLIYIHGGGWKEGDKENSITKEYAVQLANSGLSAATIDYRLSSEAIYPAQNEDVSCAVNFLVQNADKYNFDSKKMILIGDSAGGQLAAMEAIYQHHAYLGVIMAYGVSDLNEQITEKQDTNAISYLGSKATELAESNSPAFAKSFPNTSFLLLHGTADSVVPVEESKKFANILKKNGVRVEFKAIPNAQHAFLGSGDVSDTMARQLMFAFIFELLSELE